MVCVTHKSLALLKGSTQFKGLQIFLPEKSMTTRPWLGLWFWVAPKPAVAKSAKFQGFQIPVKADALNNHQFINRFNNCNSKIVFFLIS